MAKKWYTSKTLWVNILALGAMVLQHINGYVFSQEAQLAVLGVLNIFLRFQTETGIEK